MASSALTTAPTRRNQGHRKLTPEKVQTAGMMAAKGMSNRMIARGLGVTTETLRLWTIKGKSKVGTELEIALSAAIEQGTVYGALRLVQLAEEHAQSNFQAVKWLLSASPKFRADYGDNAKAEQDVLRVLNCVVDAIAEQPFLDDDQRQAIMLSIQSRCGAMEAEDYDD